MSLLQKFQQSWKEQFASLLPKEKKILLAISGGVDSVALADLLFRSDIDFEMAHCNFQLRAEDSDKDAVFVSELAARYKKHLYTATFHTNAVARERKTGIEETARNLRYDWFASLMKANDSLALLATAHHANDNIETLLINFFRGTGIAGLTGIPVKNNCIIRPLLFTGRKEITNYAQQQGLAWREDITNLSDDYTRNAFRLTILPAIQKHFPNVENNLLQNISRFRDITLLYTQAVERHKKKLVEVRGKELFLPILKWQKTPANTTLLWEVIRNYHFTSGQVAEVEKLFTADNGSYVSSASHRIFRNRNHLVISELNTQNAGMILVEEHDTEIKFAGGRLKFSCYANDNRILTDKNIALLDAARIKFPLILRKWKPGDYFYPLGMKKKKKLSRFFIDNKLSLTGKENIYVIESDKKIGWIVGMRIDERVKVSSLTNKIIKIEFLS